ncbi:serine/threonine-protein kinase [Planctomycetota bacterium]
MAHELTEETRRPEMAELLSSAWSDETPEPVRLRSREVSKLLPGAVGGDSGPATGERLGEYVVHSLLGRGGHALVYRAHHKDGREVALKIPRPDVAHRVLKEARLLERLDHPRIVGLEHAEPHGARPFVALELCEGGSLRDRLEGSAEGMPLDEVATVTEGVLEALVAAHAEGIVHRDIKPSNVLYAAQDYVKVCDFGIGTFALADDLEASLVTGGTRFAGTPLYMAPEQQDPAVGPIDGRTDLYALGKVLFTMLTGKPPRGFKPPSALRVGLHRSWDELVLRLTEERPADRFGSATEALAALHEMPAVLKGGRLAYSLSRRMRFVRGVQQLREQRRRKWLYAILAFLVVFTTLTFVGGLGLATGLSVEAVLLLSALWMAKTLWKAVTARSVPQEGWRGRWGEARRTLLRRRASRRGKTKGKR